MSRDTVRASAAFPLPLLALAAAAFAIGTSEFVIVGLLPAVAADLQVSIPRAGLLVTGYALGVALGAPPLAALTGRMRPQRALAGLMGLFIAGNLLCALAPDYGWLMVGRIVASLTHGAFFGVGATVAASLVPAERRSGAIALMFSGLTLANVLGVPAGAWIGEHAGWRATFWAVCGTGLLALAALLVLLPSDLRGQAAGARSTGWRILRRPRLLAALATTAFGFGGIFATLTYLSLLLQAGPGFSVGQVNGLLLLFGLGMTLGNVLGGWADDRWRSRATALILLALIAVELALHVLLAWPAAVIVILFLWGMAAFATAPGLQARVLDEAADAPALASTLNIGAFNLGNAIAAWVGAAALDAGLPLQGLPLLSAGLAATALAIVLAAGGRKRRLAGAPT